MPLFLLIPGLAALALSATALMPRHNFVTQQQAAAHFHVSDRTIRNKISEGVITGYRIPGSRAIRVDLDEIERQMQVMPAVMRPRQPFGPKAKIVSVTEVLSPDQDQDPAVNAEAEAEEASR